MEYVYAIIIFCLISLLVLLFLSSSLDKKEFRSILKSSDDCLQSYKNLIDTYRKYISMLEAENQKRIEFIELLKKENHVATELIDILKAKEQE